MPSSTPVFVFNSLNVQRGGLTKAVITRANMLINCYPEVHFCTLDYQQDHLDIIHELKKKRILDERIQVHYFFHDMDPYKQDLSHRIDGPKQEGEEYDNEGYLVRFHKRDKRNGKKLFTSHFSRNGNCFLTVWPGLENEERGKCVYYNPEPTEYENLYELYISWLNQKAETFRNPVFMSDSWFTDKMVARIESVPVHRVTVMHNNHYNFPYTKGAELDPDWDYLYANMEKFDRIVFLTEEQKEDIADQFGDSDRYQVISHFAEPVSEEKEWESKDLKLAVSIARYVPQKRIDEAIKAFVLVVKEIPDAEYHVYGYGPLKEELETMVNQLNLDNHVFLHDFSSNPTAVFQNAACSILTSDYEGFGLVVTESLAAGTPVVAYDVDYGPTHIIRNNIDGYLVEKGNSVEMAEKVIAIMKDTVLAKQLSSRAKEVVQRFSYEQYQRQWVSLLESLKKK